MTWLWDPDTFGAHWFDARNDRMPAPLRYRSRFPTLEGLEAHRSAVRARCGAEERERIDLLVRTVSACEMRIEIIGSTVRYHRSDGRTQKQYRVVGAIGNRYAATLYQTAIHGEYGDIRAELLRPEQLPAALAHAIPPCEPGAQRPDTFHLGDLAPTGGYLAQDDRNAPSARFHRLARRPADGGGHAILRLGDYHAPPSRHQFAQWYDITGDGRYIEQRNSTHLSVGPATPRALTDIFSAWLDRATYHLRASAAPRW